MNRIRVFLSQALHAVDRLTYDVQHASLDLLARGHTDRSTRRYHLKLALQAVGIIHCNGAHGILTDVLLNLNYEFTTVRTFY